MLLKGIHPSVHSISISLYTMNQNVNTLPYPRQRQRQKRKRKKKKKKENLLTSLISMHSIPPKDQKAVPALVLVPVTAIEPYDADYSHTADSAHIHPVPRGMDL